MKDRVSRNSQQASYHGGAFFDAIGREFDSLERVSDVISGGSPDTLFWIDETYVDYVDESESVERFASESENVVVCKSMSKVYALSGLRVGYLCGACLISPFSPGGRRLG